MSLRHPLSVVVADDTEVGRRVLVRLIGTDRDFEVVGVAKSGEEAVALVGETRPALVLMDLQMPGTDGIEATRQIMRKYPTRVVVITETFGTPAGTRAAFEALRVGAVDFLPRPGFAEIGTEMGNRTVGYLRDLSQVPVIRRSRATGSSAYPGAPTPRRGLTDIQVVAVCGSTGAPSALVRFLAAMAGAEERVLVLLVQHLLEGFASPFADWLTATSGVPVRVARDGDRLAPGVLLAPDDCHLALDPCGVLRVHDGAPMEGFRPSGTLLFESLARRVGGGAVGVLLSGMGADGVAGLAVLKEHGGRALVQAPESCAVPGMPSAALSRGIPEAALSPEELGARVRSLVMSRLASAAFPRIAS